ncbi:FMN-binding domain protein [Micromonospora sp. MW-13]|uniref:FMN-binding protein n=1 Tax=Micromonospora sp. MW-13 TaxID=2094022 RepID=UPI000E4500CB|nr:FMN-binding protein [Micromonospora sp. MW-13]RGC67860.1 FMN-binding domain protein [Micromonospora sp. MW-13]
MADQNVPPRRLRDDRGWDGRQHPTPDGYRDHGTSDPYGPSGHQSNPPYPDAPPAPAGPYPQYAPAAPGSAHRGPQWVGPDGLGRPARAATATTGYGLPNLDDDDDPGRRAGRRRALAALGGTAAVVAGGAVLAMTPQVRGLFGGDAPVGDATGTTATDGTPARPGGQQPSTALELPQETAQSDRRSDEVDGRYSGTAGQAVRKQSADLDTVSGATATSTAYRQSLQAALDRAR